VIARSWERLLLVDHPGKKIKDGGEREPSFLGGNISDIRNPDLVWFVSNKCFYQAILSCSCQDKMSSNCQLLCPRIRKD
jgi:hypothetical protein